MRMTRIVTNVNASGLCVHSRCSGGMQATTRRVDSSATDVARARDLIAEALDSYFGEPELSFALNIFDQLAAR